MSAASDSSAEAARLGPEWDEKEEGCLAEAGGGSGGEEAEEDDDDVLAISEPAYYAGYIWVSNALYFNPHCSYAPLNI